MLNFKLWLETESAYKFLEGTFGKDVFGWLSPRGIFYNSHMLEHIKTVAWTPELKRLVPRFDEEWKSLESSRNIAQQTEEDGEHPEWHVYSTSLDNFEFYVLKCLYANDCLRVGSQGNTMYFEGYPEGIKKQFQNAQDLAEEFGLLPKFEPRRLG